jgi:hypothetical protein
MSSLNRTIGRAKHRLGWPESKWRRIRLFALAWQAGKAEKQQARESGKKLQINDWTAYVRHIVEKWQQSAQLEKNRKALAGAKPAGKQRQ